MFHIYTLVNDYCLGIWTAGIIDNSMECLYY